MFCSTVDEDIGGSHAMKVGGVVYLTKPVLLNELLNQVNRVICAQDKKAGENMMKT